MKQAFRILLRLYPDDYLSFFGAEMEVAFERACAERSVGFALRELIGLVVGAMAEWFAKWTTDSSERARGMPDLRLMRPTGVSPEAWFAGATVNLSREVDQSQARVAGLIADMKTAISKHDFKRARDYALEESVERTRLETLRRRHPG
jgi:hypothetical protein